MMSCIFSNQGQLQVHRSKFSEGLQFDLRNGKQQLLLKQKDKETEFLTIDAQSARLGEMALVYDHSHRE